MAALKRRDVLNIVKSLLLADTTVLFNATTPILSAVITDQEKYDKAKVDILKPHVIFLQALDRIPSGRSQNLDYEIAVNVKIVSLNINPDTAYDRVDSIDDRVEYLINNQMWTGLNFTSYYTNSESQIYDCEYETSANDVEVENGQTRVQYEGSIIFSLNRVRV